MGCLGVLMFFAAMAAVIAFLRFYRSWLIEHKGVNPLFIGRIAVIGITGFLCIVRDQDNSASFVLILLFVLTLFIVWALNSHTAGSAFHGFFITLWQLVCVAIVIFLICGFFNWQKKMSHGRDDQNK